MGKPRLPTTGVRKPRAKDKRVGRKRHPLVTIREVGLLGLDVGPETRQEYDLRTGTYRHTMPEPETVFDDPEPESIP